VNDFLSPSFVIFCPTDLSWIIHYNNDICSSVRLFLDLVDFYGNCRSTMWLIQYVKCLVCVVAGKTELVDGRLAYSKIICSSSLVKNIGGRRRTLAREMEPDYSRTHVKCCKLVVSDANDLVNEILCIVTYINQFYSRCSYITEFEFTVSRLWLPNALFGFPPKFKMSYRN
jgi:hypothetical protein